jgi:hypothetical protein
MERSLSSRAAALVSLALVVGSMVLAVPASAAPSPLIGTFSITAGSCSGGTASGTYLRMVLSGGTNAAGPYFSNSDSSCPDNTYTLLSPGSEGGLVTGTYQAEPSPAFDGQGNALADQITAPVAFEGVKFATATNPVDPQTGQPTSPPVVEADGTSLSGNLEAFGVSWNNQQFNQGSPKPGGTSPGNTIAVSGTYDAATGAYTLQWSSQVIGGPFNGFSAYWHLTGRFTPTEAAPAPAPAPSGSLVSRPPAVTGHSPPAVSSTGALAAPMPAAAPASSGGTPTPSAPASAPATPAAAGRVVLTSQSTITDHVGWNTPVWLIVLLCLLAALGLTGMAWSERSLRQRGVPS